MFDATRIAEFAIHANRQRVGILVERADQLLADFEGQRIPALRHLAGEIEYLFGHLVRDCAETMGCPIPILDESDGYGYPREQIDFEDIANRFVTLAIEESHNRARKDY
jgi:hypothetical protein